MPCASQRFHPTALQALLGITDLDPEAAVGGVEPFEGCNRPG